MDKLFVKMSERLEQKYISGDAKPKKKNDGPKFDAKSGAEIEETLHDQVMSNTCPICYELFLPPDHQPFILFPCGHTFCKICIDQYAKLKKKCPFCRAVFNSMAPNISLQNLILSANEKRDEVVLKLKNKQEQMLQTRQFASGDSVPRPTSSSYSDSDKAEEYIENYRMLDIRTTVLHEEHQAAIDQHQGLKEQLAAKRETVSTLKHEREDCLARLRKVQKELQLIEEFERQELEAVEHLKE